MKNLRSLIETILLPAVALLAFALGYYGYTIYRPELHPTDYFISTVKLFAATFDYSWTPATAPNIPLPLTIARWLALFVMLFALAKTWTVIAKNHKRAIELTLTRKPLAIVCGLGERGYYITRHLLAKHMKVVAIESDAANPNISTARADGAIVIEGDATSETILRLAHIQKAVEVHIALGDDNKVMTAAIASQRIRAENKNATRGPLACFAHMQRPHDKELFKAHTIFSTRTSTFHPNIIDDNLAAIRQLLVDHAGTMIAPSPATGRPPRILIIGAGHIGQNLLLQMAHILHPGTGQPLDIALVDLHAGESEKEFKSQYPFITNPPDDRPFITPKFITGNIKHCDNALMEKIHDGETKSISGVFLCINNEADALAAALLLRQHHLDRQTPIVVCTDTSDGISKLFKDSATNSYQTRNIHIHNLTRSSCNQHVPTAEAIDIMAEALHRDYNNRAKETAAPFAPPEEIIDWNDLPDHFKESNRNQAANLFLSLVCAGYTFGPAATPAHPPEATEPLYTPSQLQLFGHMEHRRWMIEKYLDGWTRGERDTKNKRRPDLKPWSELDAPTQAKDTAPLASTLRLLKTVSYSIWKTPEDLKNNP